MSIVSTDYRPIDCAVHDRFEAAITRRQKLGVELLIDDSWKNAQIIPLDIISRNGEEFLEFQFSKGAERRQVRLDRVRLIEQ
jgi:transcriptional antiterminator Rof (Rho-off)